MNITNKNKIKSMHFLPKKTAQNYHYHKYKYNHALNFGRNDLLNAIYQIVLSYNFKMISSCTGFSKTFFLQLIF